MESHSFYKFPLVPGNSKNMVSYKALLVTLGLVVAKTNAATELSVTVTDGPEECDDADKVKAGDYLSSITQVQLTNPVKVEKRGPSSILLLIADKLLTSKSVKVW